MTIDTPSFPPFPEADFETILADPPWDYQDDLPGNVARGASDHYSTLHHGYVMGLGQQIREITAPRAHLYLWTTAGFIAEALQVVEAWGFEYKTMLTWVKVNEAPPTLPIEREISVRLKPYMGMGRYFRNSTEFLIFASKGNKPVNRQDIPTVFFAERLEHSRKPDKSYRLIEQASDPPRLELFSRKKREGWNVWGDEVDVVGEIDEGKNVDGSNPMTDASEW